MKVVGYLRVSTREQADSGLGLDAQRRAIAEEAKRRGWEVAWFADEGWSAKTLNRPGLALTLRTLKRHDAEAVVVAKLDRLSRSVPDFANVLLLAKRQRWAVVALDLGVDTTTPTGELLAGVMMQFAPWERRIIGQRTSDAMVEAKAQGVRFGRERLASAEVVERITAERANGASFRAIAAGLTAAGIPSPTGRPAWQESTVRRLFDAEQREAAA
jgi:DNA invertase Pin-like site-specific DNA recombinase